MKKTYHCPLCGMDVEVEEGEPCPYCGAPFEALEPVEESK